MMQSRDGLSPDRVGAAWQLESAHKLLTGQLLNLQALNLCRCTAAELGCSWRLPSAADPHAGWEQAQWLTPADVSDDAHTPIPLAAHVACTHDLPEEHQRHAVVTSCLAERTVFAVQMGR